ncbi:hypothetical protein RF11_11762 [Thelohanellus kitauei]|uniref:Uncharacterized protein n=1 Tax=Thelohanellus kitauei TaxID=669202 RepID=A0A0C2NBC2_THEKT|nr:hypothetical protein RF11_11762 [Thelohanellus kitauei]
MINNTVFPVDLDEVLRVILNFRPHAPLLLIKTSCEFSKDFIDHCDNTSKCIQIPGITFDSIYKWFAQVHVPASQVITRVRAAKKDIVSDNISDCKYLNNILVLCRQTNEVARIATLIGEIIKQTGENDAVLVLQTVSDFYTVRVRKVSEFIKIKSKTMKTIVNPLSLLFFTHQHYQSLGNYGLYQHTLQSFI